MSQNKRAAFQNRKAQVVLDEDEDGPYTQPTSTQVQRAKENFSNDQVEHKVAEVVQFILIKDQKKIPIRRPDIVKFVIKEYRALYQDIMKRAERTFEQVFGMKLVEIDSKNHIYILLNKLDPVREEPLSMCPSNPKTGLLFVILSVIFMKGGIVKEALLWNTLKKLRVDVGEKHEEFGDVKKTVIDEFVRQKYLEYKRVLHTDPQEYEFRWGPRAEKEVSKLRMLEIVAELHSKEPQSWSQQYRDASTGEPSQRS